MWFTNIWLISRREQSGGQKAESLPVARVGLHDPQPTMLPDGFRYVQIFAPS